LELSAGFKKTEAGLIPEEWAVTLLGAVCETSSGTTPSRALMDRYYKNGTIAWVKTLDLNNSDIHATGENVTELALKETCLRSYPAGTVLVAMYGGFNQIGRTGLLRRPATVNQAITAIRPDKRVLVSEYLIRNLNYRVDYWKRVASSSRKDPNITSKDIRAFPIALPAPHEQAAIADALSDTDALIESLEQLIAKKRHFKHGAMQELFTGKKRLPGFDEPGRQNSEVGEIPVDWQVIEIGKVANVKTGPFGSSLHERDYVHDGTPIITVEHLAERGVLHTNLPMVSETDRKRLSSYWLEEGDIVFSRVGSVDRNARITKTEHGWLFSGRLLRLRRLDDRIDTNYLSYQFHSEPFKERVRKVAVGQTMASLNTTILKNVLIVLPDSREEQDAIASILSDLDAEIAALEAKLIKARQLKQGMMHDLLTGKIRLV
jgi:type I restriction enzyme S subunit